MLSENTEMILAHKRLVGTFMQRVSTELFKRAVEHDYSKFSPEEFDSFEVATPKLKSLTYGSEAYKQSLEDIKPALQHHYAVNPHHPEFHRDGVAGMSLIDLIEMVCDWLAAIKRSERGDVYKSLEINKQRFGISDQLAQILENTVYFLLSEKAGGTMFDFPVDSLNEKDGLL